MSPLAEIGPVSCMTGSVGEEANLRALVSHQERRRVLLHVRTGDPFVAFHDHHHTRQQTTASSTPSPSPISEGAGAMESEEPEEAMQVCNDRSGIGGQVREQRKEGHEENAVVDRVMPGDNEDADEEVDDDDEDAEAGKRRNGENRLTRRAGLRSRDDDDDDEELEDDENINVNTSSREGSRNGNYPDDEDVEVDVCRDDADESNPSSPVDLTASSRCTGSEQFLHPFVGPRGLHPLSCLQAGVVGAAVANCVNSANNPTNNAYPGGVAIGLHPGTASNTPTTVCPNNAVNNLQPRVADNSSSSITSTTGGSVQGNKRGLAFSVENILDPNKFTGGRIIHERLPNRRRRRTGSVHEGNSTTRRISNLKEFNFYSQHGLS